MVSVDEDALICDFAETYNIYDWRSLNVKYASILASGLRDNSRIKMKMGGIKYPLETLLMASMVDRLSYLLWAKTKDGQKGKNKPKSIYEELCGLNVKKKDTYKAFKSADEFNKYRNKILERTDNG